MPLTWEINSDVVLAMINEIEGRSWYLISGFQLLLKSTFHKKHIWNTIIIKDIMYKSIYKDSHVHVKNSMTYPSSWLLYLLLFSTASASWTSSKWIVASRSWIVASRAWSFLSFWDGRKQKEPDESDPKLFYMEDRN